MPTDTRYNAALASERDARGIPTMAQIATLCGHKPDTAPSPSEARTMEPSANTPLPNDAERTLYRNGRTAEAVQMYRERVGGRDMAYCWNAFNDDRAHAYARAEAAAAIVKCARAFVTEGAGNGHYARLHDAVTAYETLLAGGE